MTARRIGRVTVGRTAAVDKHLSPAELAERYGIPLETIYAWNRKGVGPAYMRVGRYVRYREVDVITWEKSRIVTSGRVA